MLGQVTEFSEQLFHPEHVNLQTIRVFRFNKILENFIDESFQL